MAEDTFTSSARYYKIVNGQIGRKVKEKTDRSKTLIQNVKGQEYVSEVEYSPSISGYLEEVKENVSQYGTYWNIVLVDGDWKGILQILEDSNTFRMFCKQLPNMNKGVFYTLKPAISSFKSKSGTDVESTQLWVSTFGTNVGFAFTSENPKDMPPTKEVMLNGKPQIDRYDQVQFFRSLIAKYNEQPSKVSPTQASQPTQAAPKTEEQKSSPDVVESEDLPF
jgi:hypothetical protein